MKFQTLLTSLLLAASMALPGISAATPPVTKSGITTINLTEYNGYFAADETLAALKPGKYRINVTNKANKLVGFLLQDGVTHERFDMFPLEPGQTRSTTFIVTENGFRYRCPINPTPWYDVSASN